MNRNLKIYLLLAASGCFFIDLTGQYISESGFFEKEKVLENLSMNSEILAEDVDYSI